MKFVGTLLQKIPMDSKAARLIVTYGVNVGLGAASLFCFGVFAYNAATYADRSSSTTAIGAVSDGRLDQKRHGASNFTKAASGDSVFFRDTIWVGAGEQVKIEFSDETQIRLLENTFVVLLKKPGVKDAASIQVLKGNVQVERVTRDSLVEIQTLEGKVDLQQMKGKMIAARPSQEVKKPSKEAAKEPQRAPQPQGIYPVDKSLLYIVSKGEAAVTLAWPEPLSGMLILAEKNGPEIVRKELKDATSFPVHLKVGKVYEWRVHPSLPPSTFEMKAFSTEALEQQMNPDSDRVIEIIGME